jgi:hypothetical protein
MRSNTCPVCNKVIVGSDDTEQQPRLALMENNSTSDMASRESTQADLTSCASGSLRREESSAVGRQVSRVALGPVGSPSSRQGSSLMVGQEVPAAAVEELGLLSPTAAAVVGEPLGGDAEEEDSAGASPASPPSPNAPAAAAAAATAATAAAATTADVRYDSDDDSDAGADRARPAQPAVRGGKLARLRRWACCC